MKWLCILATITSFLIESKSSVTTDGAFPNGTPTVAYECSYKKGQMTKGHHATLTLEGWQNTEISRITLSMKSNKSSGAGRLSVTMDGNCVWRIDDSSFENWAGGYSTAYVPITHTFSPAVKATKGDITISVEATENSLYIEKYEIEWTQEQARPYVVSLIEDGTTVYAQLYEPTVGAGVVLPTLPDVGQWYFKGWSEQPVSETDDTPSLFFPNSVYYPTRDVSLYATYSDYPPPALQKTQRIDCQSGYYAMAFPISQRALEGAFDASITGINTCDAPTQTTEDGWQERLFDITGDMVYYIDFLTDTTAQIIHAATNQYIGYKDNKVCQGNSIWRYRVVKDSTVAFYIPRDATRSRALMAQYDDQLLLWKGDIPTFIDSLLCHQALLYEADYYTGSVSWTSYPYGQGTENAESIWCAPQEHLIQFGIYKLHIRQSKKRLLLREMY